MNNRSYIEDLVQFSPIISIPELEWWLLKYSTYYDSILNQEQPGLEKKYNQLPDVIRITEKEKFIEVFNELNSISIFHKREFFFKKELNSYHEIKNSKSKLREWVTKNENLGADEYATFIIDYLDYSEGPKHLKIFIPSLNELDIYLNRENFKYTINFLEVFKELYWAN